jgi:2-dehydro-3-deoxygalactonokinase
MTSTRIDAAFIAGDWGTTNGRLMLCDAQGKVLDTRRVPGAAEARGRFAAVFDDATGEWRGAHGELPAVLCGMAGSTIGWLEVPYLPCPADLTELDDALSSPRPGVSIVPGMRCTNPLGAPDVMRGEETQLLGACDLDAALATGRQLVCLPGTHTKWASLHEGVLQEFITAPTGEMFGLLCEHSVLVRDQATAIEHRLPEFERGLAESARHSDVSLLHQVFQARSLRMDKQLTAEGAASWVSGLLIGTDVGGALKLFPAHESGPVYVVGTPKLIESYSLALSRRGRKAIGIEGDRASLAGLAQVFRAQQDQS